MIDHQDLMTKIVRLLRSGINKAVLAYVSQGENMIRLTLFMTVLACLLAFPSPSIAAGPVPSAISVEPSSEVHPDMPRVAKNQVRGLVKTRARVNEPPDPPSEVPFDDGLGGGGYTQGGCNCKRNCGTTGCTLSTSASNMCKFIVGGPPDCGCLNPACI
jgi:hypothetical protein